MRDYISKRFPALKSRDYLIFSLTQFISNIGSQMQIVVISWQIYALTKSAFALGMIGLLTFIPILIFSLIGGSVADAHNRKKILFVSQAAMTLLSFFLAATTINGTITSFSIFLATALLATARAFDIPARQAFFPNLVDRKYFTNAVSINSILVQTSKILGPTIAGILIASSNLGTIYLLNAVSFVFVLFGLLFINTPGKTEGANTKVSLENILEGLTFIRSKTIIWSTMLLDFISTFFSSATALLPIFAQDILHVGPQQLGLLFAAPSIGAVIAGIIISHQHDLGKQGKILLGTVCVYALGTIMFGLSSIFIISFLGLFIVGIGDSISTIIRNSIRQLETPDRLRGRVSSINMIFFTGGPQLGEFEAGVLANYLGAPISVTVGGIATLIITLIIGLKIPTLRKYDKHQSSE